MFEKTGLKVFGITPLDRDEIGIVVKSKSYNATWDNQTKTWFFPEKPEYFEQLEYDLTQDFNHMGIDATFTDVN